MLTPLMAALNQVKNKFLLIGAVLLAAGLFLTGWFTHKWWSKPVTRTVTVEVPIKIGGQPSEQINHAGNVITPAVKYIYVKEQPTAPNTDDGGKIDKPDSTTVIHVPVPTAMKIDVFHQNKLMWEKDGKGYNVWVDSRIWTTGPDGKTLPGVTGETLYSKDVVKHLDVEFQVTTPKERPWAAGMTYTQWPYRGKGLWLERDFAFIRTGIEVMKYQSPTQSFTSTNIRVGGRF